VTVLAFDVGRCGRMPIMPPTDVTFLFLTQVGLILGFLTGYPAVLWLVGGIKATP